jgi:hypothetical protein
MHPLGLALRFVAGGNFCSFSAGRIGRGTNSPLQLGQRPLSTFAAHVQQNVHSNEQIMACPMPAADRGRSIRSWVSAPAC